MPKKKMSQEEIRKEIDRQVAEAQKAWLEERMYESEKLIMRKCFDELAYGYKYEHLGATYALSVAKFMIDHSRLSDEDKESERRCFADTFVWTGSGGITEAEWAVVQEAMDAIVQKLREPL